MNKNLKIELKKIELKPTGKGEEIRKAGGYKKYYSKKNGLFQPSGMQKQGRNELCNCGSGKKFKKCCLIKK